MSSLAEQRRKNREQAKKSKSQVNAKSGAVASAAAKQGGGESARAKPQCQRGVCLFLFSKEGFTNVGAKPALNKPGSHALVIGKEFFAPGENTHFYDGVGYDPFFIPKEKDKRIMIAFPSHVSPEMKAMGCQPTVHYVPYPHEGAFRVKNAVTTMGSMPLVPFECAGLESSTFRILGMYKDEEKKAIIAHYKELSKKEKKAKKGKAAEDDDSDDEDPEELTKDNSASTEEKQYVDLQGKPLPDAVTTTKMIEMHPIKMSDKSPPAPRVCELLQVVGDKMLLQMPMPQYDAELDPRTDKYCCTYYGAQLMAMGPTVRKYLKHWNPELEKKAAVLQPTPWVNNNKNYKKEYPDPMDGNKKAEEQKKMLGLSFLTSVDQSKVCPANPTGIVKVSFPNHAILGAFGMTNRTSEIPKWETLSNYVIDGMDLLLYGVTNWKDCATLNGAASDSNIADEDAYVDDMFGTAGDEGPASNEDTAASSVANVGDNPPSWGFDVVPLVCNFRDFVRSNGVLVTPQTVEDYLEANEKLWKDAEEQANTDAMGRIANFKLSYSMALHTYRVIPVAVGNVESVRKFLNPLCKFPVKWYVLSRTLSMKPASERMPFVKEVNAMVSEGGELYEDAGDIVLSRMVNSAEPQEPLEQQEKLIKFLEKNEAFMKGGTDTDINNVIYGVVDMPDSKQHDDPFYVREEMIKALTRVFPVKKEKGRKADDSKKETTKEEPAETKKAKKAKAEPAKEEPVDDAEMEEEKPAKPVKPKKRVAKVQEEEEEEEDKMEEDEEEEEPVKPVKKNKKVAKVVEEEEDDGDDGVEEEEEPPKKPKKTKPAPAASGKKKRTAKVSEYSSSDEE